MLHALAVIPLATAQDVSARETPVTKVARKACGAVVSLKALQSIPSRLEDNGAGGVSNLGTGLLFDRRGYVVTNYHVVARVQSIDATYPLDDSVPRKLAKSTARIVCFDEATDLAVLKLDGPGPFKAISLSDSVAPIQGEKVIAIGNPFGLPNSLSEGIVSEVEREMKLPNGHMFPNLIQVGANINHGNSGGPLFTVTGQLLGINAAIRSNAQGIAFAIPASTVLKVVSKMMPAPVSLASLGLKVESKKADATANDALVFVKHVDKSSAADAAGLKPDAQILRIDEEPIFRPFDLERLMWDRRYGDALHVTVRDRGVERKLTLKCELNGRSPDATGYVWMTLGMWVSQAPAKRVQHLNPQYGGALFVLAVDPRSPAERAGLQPGDVVIGLHGQQMHEAAHVVYVLSKSAGQSIECMFMRDGELQPITRLVLPALKPASGAAQASVHAGNERPGLGID
jgi:serine protease Do